MASEQASPWLAKTDLLAVTHEPLAHLGVDRSAHLLRDHLIAVGELAATFARAFASEDWGRLAGRWHDLGKYGPDFQIRIRTENGVSAHIEGDHGSERDHSSAGAVHALRQGHAGAPLAFAIAGHHAGLSDSNALLNERLRKKEERYRIAAERAHADILAGAIPALPRFEGGHEEQRRSLELWIRLLFSALCDADFLDTERFYRPGAAELRGRGASIEVLSDRLDAHLDEKTRQAPASEVNRVRAAVRSSCQASAELPQGVFSLTVPTGGGKTLASLNFALRHAKAHGLRRVVVAIPFTSIIEQTADAFRNAVGDDGSVLEHHSSLDPVKETPATRVATENWDAPIVVTTTVQLLESLLACRTSSCRKLHRLARSVIILDEAQALRIAALAPAIDVLHALVREHGVTLVICTATQPAWRKSRHLACGFTTVQEIVSPDLRAHERLRRVTVHWPDSPSARSFPDLAPEIAQRSDVLAIVHRRKDARELCEAIDARLGDKSTVHLSALMCAEHRWQALSRVREEKRRGRPVRLIATQLVEAGVDLDFPIVYRAMAGLDALAQAAGRCNREGRLETGHFYIFNASTSPPPGVLATGLAVAQGMRATHPALDLFSPEVHHDYFSQLLGNQQLDADQVQAHRARLNYREVARRFRLIEDEWSAPIVVPWGAGQARVEELRSLGATRERMRRLQRYIVQVSRKSVEAWLASGAAELVEEVAVLRPAFANAYDERFGLIPELVGSGSTRPIEA